ncbi:MAG: SMC family ATPase [Candidatus Nezhaarchaeales archaeon]
MIINRVELRNFISHRQTLLDFDLGVTAIVGPNGAGKTSILDAISFALFRSHSRGRSLDNLINRASNTASVRLWFTSGGRQYLVEREIGRRGAAEKSEARLYEVLNGSKRLIAEGARPVTEEIKSIIGMDESLFRQAAYVRQGEIESLLAREASERKKMISKLLGISDLEEAYELMRSVVSDEEARLRALEKEIEVLKSRWDELAKVEDRLKEVVKEGGLIEDRLRRARERAEGLRGLLDWYEEVGRRSREIEGTINSLLLELERKYGDAKRLEGELVSISQLEEEAARLSAIKERYELLRSELSALAAEEARLSECRRQAQRLEEEVKEGEGELSAIEEEMERELERVASLTGAAVDRAVDVAKLREGLEARLEEVRREAEEARRRVEELLGAVAERRGLLEELAANPYECPVCERELSAELSSSIAAKLKAELEGLSARLEEARRREEGLERELEGLSKVNLSYLERLVKEARERRRRLEEGLAELGGWLRELERAERRVKELEGIRDELNRLEGDYRRYLGVLEALGMRPPKDEVLSKLASIKAAIEEVSSKVELLRRERDRLGYSAEAYAKIKSEYEAADRELKELIKRSAEIESEKRYLESRRRELEEVAAKLREREGERALRAKLVELLKGIRASFGKDGVQKLVRARATPLIEHYAREYLSKFDLEYSDIKLNEDFEPTLIGPLGEQPIDSISGGERVAVALALRLAIAKAIAEERLEFMILDEPTIHLDELRRRELVEILKRFFKEGPRTLPQLIVVTHEREVEEAADAVYYVTREAGFSKVSTEARGRLASG